MPCAASEQLTGATDVASVRFALSRFAISCDESAGRICIGATDDLKPAVSADRWHQLSRAHRRKSSVLMRFRSSAQFERSMKGKLHTLWKKRMNFRVVSTARRLFPPQMQLDSAAGSVQSFP
jgi:hypothetical protein